jgi:glucokinase
MEIKWHNPEAAFDRLVLAGDIGGTNTNLGLVSLKNGKFTIILEVIYASQSIADLVEPIREILRIAKERRGDLVVSNGCICAAGPVADNKCVMTNLHWSIDGDALSRELGIAIRIINDFMGISYGIPTLDINDPAQIHVLRHANGTAPVPQNAMKAVIGPGTGLGVGVLAWDGKRHVPASSEGGHMTFAPFDADSQSFRDYLYNKMQTVPGVEPLVSGMGIKNMYEWWRDTKGLPTSAAWDAIAQNPDDRPRLISRLSDTDPVAADMMRLFVRMLARFASDVSCLLLPLGGFYLAGGVAQKELRWIEGDSLFMKTFERNYNPNIRPLLDRIPVYIIKDYSISLYGAANACLQLDE